MFDYIPFSQDPSGGNVTTIGDVLGMSINIMMGIVFALGFISLAAGFVIFVTSRGNPDGTARAGKAVLYGAGAVALSLLVLVIKEIIFKAIGVEGVDTVPAI